MSIETYPFIIPNEDPRVTLGRELGMKRIRERTVAALTLAGGQGTRLGFNGPKGLYQLGPPIHRTLFELHAERIRQRSPLIPWYIMTSSATHAETVKYFQENHNFGLEVTFFQQADEPSTCPDGTPIPGTASPNGNGDVYAALARAGLIQKMQQQGIRWIFIFNVDNVLCDIVDPSMIALALWENFGCLIKVVTKRHPDEKLGSLILKAGRPEIIEYTDVPSNLKSEVMDGYIGIQLMTLEFIRKAAKLDLPRHLARKKIKCPDGTWVDGIKSEKFIFDAFPLVQLPLGALRVLREKEFSPLKNATGEDSPETCRQDLSRELRRIS